MLCICFHPTFSTCAINLSLFCIWLVVTLKIQPDESSIYISSGNCSAACKFVGSTCMSVKSYPLCQAYVDHSHSGHKCFIIQNMGDSRLQVPIQLVKQAKILPSSF